MPGVKKFRKYDSRGRSEHAQRNRETIIDVARDELLSAGYAATTIASIAKSAGVSVETIYKSFGGKPGLVRAIYERGLAGRGPIAAPDRADATSKHATDARDIIRNWGRLAAEVAPLVVPILLLIRSAASTDSDLAELLHESDKQRLTRMRHNARTLANRGFLRDDMTLAKATDIMWTYSSPEVYELLVERRGWSAQQLGDFIASSLIAALL